MQLDDAHVIAWSVRQFMHQHTRLIEALAVMVSLQPRVARGPQGMAVIERRRVLDEIDRVREAALGMKRSAQAMALIAMNGGE